MLKPVLITPPAELAVSVAEAKAHLRVEHSDDDTLISAMVKAAIGALDGWTGVLGRCLVTQTWRQDVWDFPGSGDLRLPFPDVSSVTVKYFDGTNVEQTLASGNYELLADARGSLVRQSSTGSWPGVYDRSDAVRVTFAAGYGGAADVPETLKAAIKLMVGDMYRNRETAAAGQISQIPMSTTVDMLIAPYRRMRV